MLLQDDFCFLQVKPQEAGVYYRERPGSMQVVLGICYHPGFSLSGEQLAHMKQQVQSHLQREWGVSNIEMLTLFLADHTEGLQELCLQDDSTWLLDLTEKRLLIYENQKGEFYGLRQKIQNLLEAETSQQVNAGQQMGTSRQMEAGRQMNVKHQTGTEAARYLPWVTIGLVAVNVIVFFVLELIGDTNDGWFMYQHGASFPEAVVDQQQYYRLFTCVFLHFGMEHLLNNMVLLGCVGSRLERYCGRVRFLLIYLIAGLGSSVLSVAEMVHTQDYAVSAGASGAIFGIIGALLLIAIKNKGRVEGLSSRGLILMTALCLYYGFVSAGVDNWGHIGGLITGFIVSIFLGKRDFSRKKKI